MKNAISFILSELFMYAIALGIILIMYPSVQIQMALIFAFVVYAISTVFTLVTTKGIEFIIKLIVNKYSKKKETTE